MSPPSVRSLVLVLLCAAWASCGRSSLTGLGEDEGPGAAGTGGRAGVGGQAGTSGGAGTFGAAGTGAAGTSGGPPDAGIDTRICVEGATECDGTTRLRICKDGQWGLTLTCPNFCANNACTAECLPGTTDCSMPGLVRVCSADGNWGAPRPRGVECGTNNNPKTVFVTSLTFQGGALGGLEGADAICGKMAVNAGLPGTFRAWLSDETGSPATRFTRGDGPYQLVTGTFIAKNWQALTTLPLVHAIDLTELGTTPPLATGDCMGPAVWSNTTASGRVYRGGFSCGRWDEPMSVRAAWGRAGSIDAWTDACDLLTLDPTRACSSSAALYCFEQ